MKWSLKCLSLEVSSEGKILLGWAQSQYNKDSFLYLRNEPSIKEDFDIQTLAGLVFLLQASFPFLVISLVLPESQDPINPCSNSPLSMLVDLHEVHMLLVLHSLCQSAKY